MNLKNLSDEELSRELDRARARIADIAGGAPGGLPEVEAHQDHERAIWDERLRRARESREET